MSKKLTLIIATSNLGKVKEITEALKDLKEEIGLEIESLKDFPEIPPPEETGKTFLENAMLKAKYYAEKTGCLCLADDSGLEVDALKGAPGVYSSRYAGEGATDEKNNQKLLQELAEAPFEKRTARFKCVMVLYHPTGKYLVSEGVWEGRIGFEPKGSFGFGYDPLFLVPEYNYQKTAAELPLEEKNRLSHRGKALQNLKKEILPFLKQFTQC
ncbi:XTP/dITP diphosphatase [Thermodesulfobacterium sp. TA1]|uniref:XTP/dITP diphosphatase n=1 Tax=Thermodesulfobacterium sp. TA1 TaxID=2234087 RepID=UPI0012328EA7|nr:XTP/dITP diphosphatase [Thermodesulfobacterium sp. TA1]QER42140.1 XTP/dITP diphosphatase [Thermodesulfobacterium sp. TA1]